MATPKVMKIGSALVVFLAPLTARAANTYYVAPGGSDTAAGTMAAPFASWARAQTAVAAGDTVYFRGGTYKYTDATSTCSGTSARISAVVLTKSGASGSPIRYQAYPGETPIFDFSGITNTSKYNCRQTGVAVQADWLYLKGLQFTGTLQLNNLNHESWCVYIIGGNNNTFEMLDAHHNMGPGFFIQQGGQNTFLNCDSHENEDTLTSNGDGQSADGFGCHPTKAGDTGNLFHGCRAWWNSDDNWDFINSTEACTVEYSWAWYAGYKPDTLTNGAPVSLAAGNGNGIKAGGYGDPQTNVPTPAPQHVVRFNASFYNKVAGFYANHEIVSPFFYNNTSYDNGTDYDMLGLNGTTVTSVGTLRNNIAYAGRTLTSNMNNGGPISDQFNSWDASLNVKVTDADFQSVAFKPAASCPPTDTTCFAGMASARAADGSLPVMPFLRLTAQSPLIDKGTDVGLPFVGKAPDLGAFEYGAVEPGGGGSSAGGSNPGASGATGTSAGGPAAGGSDTGTGGGADAAGGAVGLGGGVAESGGAPPDNGSGGSATASGGMAVSSGGSQVAAAGNAGSSNASSGCSCRTAGVANRETGAVTAFGWLLFAAVWRRRRVRTQAEATRSE